MQLYLNKAVVYRKTEGQRKRGTLLIIGIRGLGRLGRRYSLQSSGAWPQSSLIFKLHGLVKPFTQPGPFSQFSDKKLRIQK